MKNIFIYFIACLLLITTVSATNWTTSFNSEDQAIYNQSSTMDNGTYTPWEFYWAAGILSLVMLFFSLRPSEKTIELEVEAIISIVSLIPISFCAWASFNGVDRIIGYGVTSQSGIYAMMTQHITYTFPIIGVIMAVFFVATIGNFLRILAQHKMFKIKEEQEELRRGKDQKV